MSDRIDPDELPRQHWGGRELALSRAVDAAMDQRDAALAVGDAEVAAVFARALAELEQIMSAALRAG